MDQKPDQFWMGLAVLMQAMCLKLVNENIALICEMSATVVRTLSQFYSFSAGKITQTT